MRHQPPNHAPLEPGQRTAPGVLAKAVNPAHAMKSKGQTDSASRVAVGRLRFGFTLVELLAVIQEKTKGNLSGQEERALGEALRELKMSYVEIANEVSKQMQDQLKKGPPPKR